MVLIIPARPPQSPRFRGTGEHTVWSIHRHSGHDQTYSGHCSRHSSPTRRARASSTYQQVKKKKLTQTRVLPRNSPPEQDGLEPPFPSGHLPSEDAEMAQDNWADADLHEQSSNYSELYSAELHPDGAIDHDAIYDQYESCDPDLYVEQHYHDLEDDPAEDIDISVSGYINPQFPPPTVFPICVEEDTRSESQSFIPSTPFPQE